MKKTFEDLLLACLDLAKAQDSALRSASKAAQECQTVLPEEYTTLVRGNICTFVFKTERGYAGQAGVFCFVDEDELVFELASGKQYRVWQLDPTLVVNRVTTVAAPEIDKLSAHSNDRQVKSFSQTIYERLREARKRGL